MRKRSFLQVFDFVAWFMIGLLPIIYALFTCVYSSNGIITINSFTSAIDTFFSGFTFTTNNNVIYNVLYFFFNCNYSLYLGFEPFLKCIAFFGTVQIVHFVLDVVLFIPKLCMKFMDKVV